MNALYDPPRARRIRGRRLPPAVLSAIAIALIFTLGIIAAGCSDSSNGSTPAPGSQGAFQQVNLASNRSAVGGAGAVVDANLLNPWGIAFAPGRPIWISDNHAGVSTLYDGNGAAIPPASPLVVKIPGPGNSGVGAPTGIVVNSTPGFILPSAGGKPASFIFATEDGTIYGWNGSAGKTAVQEVDNSSTTGAVYKGLTTGTTPAGSFIYATDFHNARVDVFNSQFQQQPTGAFPFTDPGIPAGFAPFGIQNIGGQIFVTYARQDNPQNAHDDARGPGRGFVDVYSPTGILVSRLASGGALNSPWGLTQAPAGFGPLGNLILVGNFGDGTINVYNPNNGLSLGPLKDALGNPIVINGLWALVPGGGLNTDPNAVYFTAGANDENDGIFGKLQAASAARHS